MSGTIRIDEQVARLIEMGLGKALVLVDRSSEVDDFLKDMFPDLKEVSAKRSGKLVGSAYQRGKTDGEFADLGQSKIGNVSKGELG